MKNGLKKYNFADSIKQGFRPAFLIFEIVINSYKMKKNIKAVCFGEVLFDNFPTQSKIWVAPLNISGRLQAFGVDVSLIISFALR